MDTEMSMVNTSNAKADARAKEEKFDNPITSIEQKPSVSTAEHAKPTVLVRKPRTRRLLRSLLCCFGAEQSRADGTTESQAAGHQTGQGGSAGQTSLPLQTQSSNGQPVIGTTYSPKVTEKLLLPQQRPGDANKLCLIIDLDETLVHSSFKPVKNPDFVIPVEIDGVVHQVYVLKRPHVDEFLKRIGEQYECVLFTASLAKYADPVADLLDKWNVFKSRLFREACVFHKGNYVKDLNRLGRDLKRVIIIDNSPASYAFHPDNAIPVQSWFDDMQDRELLDLIPLLERLANVDNVYSLLRTQLGSGAPAIDSYHNNNNNNKENSDKQQQQHQDNSNSNNPIASVARPR